LLEVEDVEYFTFLRLNICYDFDGMIFTLEVACLWQQQCAVMIHLFISFTDSQQLLQKLNLKYFLFTMEDTSTQSGNKLTEEQIEQLIKRLRGVEHIVNGYNELPWPVTVLFKLSVWTIETNNVNFYNEEGFV
jgi:hypothetical protein